MGSTAYFLIDRMRFREGEIAVEIGADRGEGSTGFLESWCSEHGVRFVSIDIDPDRPAHVIADGADWLHRCHERVGFAYLDNFDWIYPEIEHRNWVQDQRDRYEELGYILNNHNSKLAHWYQAMALQNLTQPGAMIVFDDTWADIDGYHGKGGLAVPWLLDNCWHVERTGEDKWSGFFALRRHG